MIYSTINADINGKFSNFFQILKCEKYTIMRNEGFYYSQMFKHMDG